MTLAEAVSRRADRLAAALAYPLTETVALAVALVVAALTYVVLVVSTFPQFAVGLLARDVGYVPYVIVALTEEVLVTTGVLGLTLVVVYALVTGVATANVLATVRRTGASGATTLTGVVPGVAAAGCASCGAGVLGLLGFTGALAVLPFRGNLIRVAGILLLLWFMGRAGDPRACRVGR